MATLLCAEYRVNLKQYINVETFIIYTKIFLYCFQKTYYVLHLIYIISIGIDNTTMLRAVINNIINIIINKSEIGQVTK